MDARCKPGDLAIVVHAQHPRNLGTIVRIVAPHDGSGDIVFSSAGMVWLVDAAQPMLWTKFGRRYYRRRGPVPDNRLKPIRGLPEDGPVERTDDLTDAPNLLVEESILV